MPSQSSQIVVAPRSIMFSHDGRGALEEQLVRDVGVARVGEHRQQVAGGEEARAQVRICGADELDEACGRGIPHLLRE